VRLDAHAAGFSFFDRNISYGYIKVSQRPIFHLVEGSYAWQGQ
jgi:hypothetical protein